MHTGNGNAQHLDDLQKQTPPCAQRESPSHPLRVGQQQVLIRRPEQEGLRAQITTDSSNPGSQAPRPQKQSVQSDQP